jgi:hypothetical protein
MSSSDAVGTLIKQGGIKLNFNHSIGFAALVYTPQHLDRLATSAPTVLVVKTGWCSPVFH